MKYPRYITASTLTFALAATLGVPSIAWADTTPAPTPPPIEATLTPEASAPPADTAADELILPPDFDYSAGAPQGYPTKGGIKEEPLTEQGKIFQAEKEALRRQIEIEEAAKSALNISGTARSSGVERTWLPSIEKQVDWYMCGPASLKNMIYGFTKGAVNLNQWDINKEVKASQSAGPGATTLSNYLNRHYSGWGSWRTYGPTSGNNLKTYILASVRAKNSQAIIMNVDGSKFDYWGRPFNNGHYNLGLGVDHDAGDVIIGEVADHVSGSFYHRKLDNAYLAISNSPGKVLVG